MGRNFRPKTATSRPQNATTLRAYRKVAKISRVPATIDQQSQPVRRSLGEPSGHFNNSRVLVLLLGDPRSHVWTRDDGQRVFLRAVANVVSCQIYQT